MNIEDFKGLMDGFDPLSLLPEVSEVTASMAGIARFIVLIGPVALLVMGLVYRFATPKEANHHLGYRTYFGMGSVEAWRYSQHLAGYAFGGLEMMLILKGVCLKEPKRTIPATQLHRAIKTGVICFIAQKRALPMARNVVGRRGYTEKCKKLGGLSVRLHGARRRMHCAKTKKKSLKRT